DAPDLPAADRIEHARIAERARVADPLQIELLGIDAARGIDRKNEREVDRRRGGPHRRARGEREKKQEPGEAPHERKPTSGSGAVSRSRRSREAAARGVPPRRRGGAAREPARAYARDRTAARARPRAMNGSRQ